MVGTLQYNSSDRKNNMFEICVVDFSPKCGFFFSLIDALACDWLCIQWFEIWKQNGGAFPKQ